MMGVRINKILALLIVSFFVGNSVLGASYEISDGSVKALYHLEDNVDSSGGGYNLSNTGGVSFGAAKFTNGAEPTHAIGKYLSIANSFGIGSGQSNVSYSYWVKQNSQPVQATEDYLGHFYHDISSGYRTAVWYQQSGGVYRIYLRLDGGGYGGTYNVDLGTTNWHHIVVTRKSDGAYKLYLDGVERISGTATGYSAGSNGFMLQRDFDRYGDQIIDDFVVVNKVLSQSDVDSIYNSGTGREICNTTGCSPITPNTPTSSYVSNVSTSSLTYTWATSTGATFYNVYKNNTFHASTTAYSYNFTALTPDTTYIFNVSAGNGAGISATSSSISTTTLPYTAPTSSQSVTSNVDTSKIELIGVLLIISGVFGFTRKYFASELNPTK